ncbi:MAG: aminopeptidase P family N-terminal domain-containing protein, partial [Candidatus Acidiferrales bacterium]
MKISRRDVFKNASFAFGGVAIETTFSRAIPRRRAPEQTAEPLPPAFGSLKPFGDRVKPIRTEELQARIAHAQQLMTDTKPRFEALYVTPSTTLVYYTGIHWWPSERILALLIPRQGDPLLVSPAFEEGRLR